MKQLLSIIAVTTTLSAFAQQIDLDKVVRAGELTLFQEIKNPKAWYYVIDKPRLARDEKGKPKFSFLRYVDNQRSGAGEAEKREGEGGGIVHALIELGVTDEQLEDARSALRSIVPKGVIRGPVAYREGSIAIISSFVNPNGERSRQVLGIGSAPLLDGHRAAVSIELTKKGAGILWESFKTPTPDMSISFEMRLQGYHAPIRAMIEADFDRIYDHKDFRAGLAMAKPLLAADIKATFESMRANGDIKVTTIGNDADMNKAVEIAYNKLVEMMFQPSRAAEVPAKDITAGAAGESMLDRATEMLNKGREEVREENLWAEEARNLPSFAVAASFEMKRIRQRGKFKIDLNKYTTDHIMLRFDKNFGDIRCGSCFREINLDDPLFKQRELLAFIDGANAKDFGDYINFVTLAIKKKHESGEITNDEVRIDRNNFNAAGNNFKLLYGWKGDDDRSKWLDYEYRAVWSFFGGHSVAGDWTADDAGSIALAPPLLRRTITLEADPETVAESKIRAIDVSLFYTIGDEEQRKSINLKKDQLSKTTDIILPRNVNEYEYEINWRLRGKKYISSGRQTTSSSILFVDELPEEEEEGKI